MKLHLLRSKYVDKVVSSPTDQWREMKEWLLRAKRNVPTVKAIENILKLIRYLLPDTLPSL
jgi:hypothetical protein